MSSSTPDGPANDGTANDGTVHDGAREDAPATDAPTTPAPADDAPAADDGPTPHSPEEPQDVTLLVDPGRVRRAPKYPVFLWVGALVGAVVGLIFSTWLIDVSGSAETLMKPGVYVAVTVLGGIALGLGVAGLLAVVSDRRSLRRR
ncbi:histidine kinase [Isoptericola sp. NPDC055881]